MNALAFWISCWLGICTWNHRYFETMEQCQSFIADLPNKQTANPWCTKP